jgi:uncharacterized Fe-S center protein
MKNKNHEAVAKPFYTSTNSIQNNQRNNSQATDKLINYLQQVAKQMDRKYPQGYQGL